MSNFGGRLRQPKQNKLLLGISFFCQHNSTGSGFLILKQIICIIRSPDIRTVSVIFYPNWSNVLSRPKYFGRHFLTLQM
jgi:hypothetical protein